MPTYNCVSLEEVLPIMHYNIPTMHSMFDCWLLILGGVGISTDPLWHFTDPYQVDCQSTPPSGSTLSEVILAMSLWILSKLAVDQPPSPPSPPLWDFADPFQVDCRLTPPPLPSLPTSLGLCGSFPS